MSLEHCQIVPIPDLISRVTGNDHLSLGLARYVSFGGHAVDAEILLNGDSLTPTRAHTLGVSTHENAEDPSQVVVSLTVPFEGGSQTYQRLARIPGSLLEWDVKGRSLMFGVPQASSEEAFYEAVPLLLPKKLHHSAGALLNFAHVMAFYLPK